MINIIREFLHKLLEQPHNFTETILDAPDGAAYSEMISNDLQEKYEGKFFRVPIELINFDALMESLAAMGHPSIQTRVTKPYAIEDFADLDPDMAEVITDYMNTNLKLLVNSAIQEYLKEERIKMSADADGIQYYTEEEDDNINGLIKLERDFRSV